MRDSDEAIEKVLAGLRDAEPGAGMERRVLAAVRERAAVVGARGGRRWWVLAPGFAAVAGVVFVAGMLLPGRKVGVVPVVGRGGPAVQAVVEGHSEVGGTRVHGGIGVRARGRVRREAGEAVVLEVGTGLRVGNAPAPPMPLTEEERLLQGMARRGDLGRMGAEAPMFVARAEPVETLDLQRLFGVLWTGSTIANEENNNAKQAGCGTETDNGRCNDLRLDDRAGDGGGDGVPQQRTDGSEAGGGGSVQRAAPKVYGTDGRD